MASTPKLPREEPDGLPGWLLAAWLVTGIALATVAALAVRREDRAARADWQSRLSRAADDRLALADRALHQWREEVHLLGRLESVRSLLTRSSGGRLPAMPDPSLLVRSALDEAAQAEPGAVVSVADRLGNVVVSTGNAAVGPDEAAPVRRAIREHRMLLSRIGPQGSDGLDLEIAAPVLDDSGEAAGAVVLVVDAREAFADLFPRSDASGPERLFVVVPEGERYLIVAPAHVGEPGEGFRLPASDRSTFAAAALAGPRAGGEYSDGRGHRVLAATRRLPEIGWAIVVEVDRGTALAESRRHTLWILFGAVGLFAAFVGIGHAWRRALTARHYREASQRDARYRVLLEQTQEAVAVTIDGRVAYANPACVDMFGYQKPLIGVPVTIFFAPGSREQVEEIVQHRMAGRPAPELYEAVGLRGDGTTFAVELRVTPVEFEGQTGSQAVLRDITGRKRMEAEIRESEERYRLLFERNLAGVYRSALDGRLLECNRAFAQMMGYASPAEAMAQPGLAFHASPGAREQFLERLGREGSLVNFENQARRKDGSLIWIVENVSLLRSDDGEEVLLGTVFDMTERRRLEEQLLQSQKMEAVGRLAGGIAHDFNNLLTAVAGYSELLLRELPEGDPSRESAEEIRQAGNRAAALTQQLLAFSRRQVLEPRVLDLNAVITGMERMLRRVIGEDVELTSSLDPELWRTRADPGQIEQAILNLVVNARDAMPRGGQLTLETANVELDETFAGHYATVHPGPHVMLAVSDTGVGMDAELQARLFEPFFTTKAHGKGTGLGLSTTYGIVKQSGGSIWVYSEPGHGTTFKIYLPRCEEPIEDRVAPPPARETAAPGTESVLLVEDEPEVRRLVEKLLRLKGYRVLSAASPADAIAISRRHEASIDLLLTDVIMPGMNGRELSRVLAPTRPSMRVLYMSGYTDVGVSQQGILARGTAFLSKPFTPEALARKVREVLDGPAAT
jgi:PAS domain S-box-containing protein